MKFFVFSDDHSNSVIDIFIYLCFKQKTYSLAVLFSLKMDPDNNNNNNSSSDECIVLSLSPLLSASSTGTETPNSKRTSTKVRLSAAEVVSEMNEFYT